MGYFETVANEKKLIAFRTKTIVSFSRVTKEHNVIRIQLNTSTS